MNKYLIDEKMLGQKWFLGLVDFQNYDCGAIDGVHDSILFLCYIWRFILFRKLDHSNINCSLIKLTLNESLRLNKWFSGNFK